MTLPTKIHFWDDVIILPSFEKEIERIEAIDPSISRKKIDDVIFRIRNGEFSRGRNFESLENYPTYACVLIGASRLILVTLSKDDKKYLCPLEIIINHNYHKSNFQSEAMLINHLESHCGLKVKPLNQRDYQIELTEHTIPDLVAYFQKDMQPIAKQADSAEPSRKKPVSITRKKTYYYNGAHLNLTQEQDGVSTNISCSNRGVIMGPPGSGKSFITFDMLSKQYKMLEESIAANNTDPEDDPVEALAIVYCCASKALCENMEGNWTINREITIADEEVKTTVSAQPRPRVLFKTYDEILIEYYGIRVEQLVDTQYFTTWYSGYFKAQRNLKKTRALEDADILTPFKSPQHVYKALRRYCKEFTTTGPRAEEKNESDKKYNALYRVYAGYTQHLADNVRIDPVFYVIPAGIAAPFSFVNIDETQDLSSIQINNVQRWVDGEQRMIFYLDTHQSLVDPDSKVDTILQMLKTTGDRSAIIERLAESHRCGTEIIDYLNRLLQLRHRLFAPNEKNQKEPLIAAKGAPSGSLRIICRTDLKKQEFQNLSDSADVALIFKDQDTLQQQKEQAYYTKFPQQTTPVGAKGLEYKVVIAPDVLGFLFRLEAILERHDSQASDPFHYESKIWSEDEINELITLINTIYVTCSRAKEHLILVETDETFRRLHMNPSLFAWLSPQKIPSATQAASAETLTLEASDKSVWEKRMQSYIALNELQMAFDIFQKQLNMGNIEDFNTYCDSLKQQTAPTPPVLPESPAPATKTTASKKKKNRKNRVAQEATPATEQPLLPSVPTTNILINKLYTQLKNITVSNLYAKLFSDKDSIFNLIANIPELTHNGIDLHLKIMLIVQEWLWRFPDLGTAETIDTLFMQNDLLNKLYIFTKDYPHTTTIYHMILMRCMISLETRYSAIKKIPQLFTALQSHPLFTLFCKAIAQEHPSGENSLWHYLVDNHRFFKKIIQLIIIQKLETPESTWFLGFTPQSVFCSETLLSALSKIFSFWLQEYHHNQTPAVPLFKSAIDKLIEIIHTLDLPNDSTKSNIAVPIEETLSPLQKIMRIIHPDHAHPKIGFAILHRLYDLEIGPLAKPTENRTFWKVKVPEALKDTMARKAFYLNFFNSVDGLNILSGLLIFSEKIARTIIFDSALFEPQVFYINGNSIKCCPFYLLSTNTEGISILNQLIDEPQNTKSPDYRLFFDTFETEIREIVRNQKNPKEIFLFNIINHAFDAQEKFNPKHRTSILFVIDFLTQISDILFGLSGENWIATDSSDSVSIWLKLLSDDKQKDLLDLLSLLIDAGGKTNFIPKNDITQMIFIILNTHALIKNMQLRAILKKILIRYLPDREIVTNIVERILYNNEELTVIFLFFLLEAQNTVEDLIISIKLRGLFKRIKEDSRQRLMLMIADEPQLQEDPRINEIIRTNFNLPNCSPLSAILQQTRDNYNTQIINQFRTVTNPRGIFKNPFNLKVISAWIGEQLKQPFTKDSIPTRTDPHSIHLCVQENIIHINDLSLQKKVAYALYSEFLLAVTTPQEISDDIFAWMLKQFLINPCIQKYPSYLEYLTDNSTRYYSILSFILRSMKIPSVFWFEKGSETIGYGRTNLPILCVFESLSEALLDNTLSEESIQSAETLAECLLTMISDLTDIPNGFHKALLYKPSHSPHSYLNILTNPRITHCGNVNFLLKILLTNPKEITDLIPVEKWFVSTQENLYPLYNLTQSEEGINFLNQLFKTQSEYSQKIFANIPEYLKKGTEFLDLLHPLIHAGLNYEAHENLINFILLCIEKHTPCIRHLGISVWLPPTSSSPQNNETIVKELLSLIRHSNPLGLKLCTAMLMHCPELLNTGVLNILIRDLMQQEQEKFNSGFSDFITLLRRISRERPRIFLPLLPSLMPIEEQSTNTPKAPAADSHETGSLYRGAHLFSPPLGILTETTEQPEKKSFVEQSGS